MYRKLSTVQRLASLIHTAIRRYVAHGPLLHVCAEGGGGVMTVDMQKLLATGIVADVLSAQYTCRAKTSAPAAPTSAQDRSGPCRVQTGENAGGRIGAIGAGIARTPADIPATVGVPPNPDWHSVESHGPNYSAARPANPALAKPSPGQSRVG